MQKHAQGKTCTGIEASPNRSISEGSLLSIHPGKYRQHYWLIKALGQLYCLKFREEAASKELGNISVTRDYTDRLSMEYNDSAMSTGLGGGNSTVGMEGFLWKTVGSNGSLAC